MAYQVLARKWRPKTFQSVIGQKHITQSLQNILKRGNIGQAYIFTGTRGIGKTSCARLFAKAIRCEHRDEQGNPCGHCDACLDFDNDSSMNVIEIDGASNNGVDNIRELINEVQFLPTTGKYKIYIIDEVHMVTPQAFNALLKTLEEPPEHVIFLFATTEPDKLLGTVLSRCQRFDFRQASVNDLVDHLKMICKEEGITYENESILHQIATQGNGSVRDTLSLLDQVLSFTFDNKITEETLVISLGLASKQSIDQLINAILACDEERVSELYRAMISENVSVKNILSSIHENFYAMIMDMRSLREAHPDLSVAELYWVFESIAKDASWILDSLDPERVAEIELKKMALRRSFFAKSSSPLIAEQKKNLTPEPESKQEEEIKEEPKVEAPIEEPLPAFEGPMPEELEPITDEYVPPIADFGDKTWENFLKYLTETSQILASYLEQGNIVGDLKLGDGHVGLTVGFEESERAFYEIFEDKETSDNLRHSIATFFGVNVENVDLKIEMVNNENFVSMSELAERKFNQTVDEKKNALLNDPLVIEAQKLFDAQIDKVIINDRGNNEK